MKPQKLTFSSVLGEDLPTFSVKATGSGYECFINEQKVPAVLSHRLMIGDGIPRVALEIAVASYETDRMQIELADA